MSTFMLYKYFLPLNFLLVYIVFSFLIFLNLYSFHNMKSVVENGGLWKVKAISSICSWCLLFIPCYYYFSSFPTYQSRGERWFLLDKKYNSVANVQSECSIQPTIMIYWLILCIMFTKTVFQLFPPTTSGVRLVNMV